MLTTCSHHIFSPVVYRPKGNGRAETAVRLTIESLRKIVNEVTHQSVNWVTALPSALWNLNDLPGVYNPYSPHFLGFGRNPIAFGDVPPPGGAPTLSGCHRILWHPEENFRESPKSGASNPFQDCCTVPENIFGEKVREGGEGLAQGASNHPQRNLKEPGYLVVRAL